MYFIVIPLMLLFYNSANLFALTWEFSGKADFRSSSASQTLNVRKAQSSTTNYVEGWTDEIRMTDSYWSSKDPSIINDTNGLHLIWAEAGDSSTWIGPNLYYTKSIDTGKIWSVYKQITSTKDRAAYTSMASESNILHLVWSDSRDGNYGSQYNEMYDNYEIYYKRSSDGGQTWSQDYRLSYSTGYSGNLPYILSDGNVLHVLWADNKDGNYQIYYCTSTDGGNHWGLPRQITSGTQDSMAPKMIKSSDTLHLVWQRFMNTYTEILYSNSIDNGQNWTLPLQLSSAPCAQVPYIINDESNPNTLYLVYSENKASYDANKQEIYFKLSFDNGQTWLQEKKITTIPGSGWPRLVSDNYGLHLAWTDGIILYYMKSLDSGNTWSSPIQLSYPNGLARRLVMTTIAETIHIFYSKELGEHGFNTDIFYKRYDPTSPTGKPTTPIVKDIYYGQNKMEFSWTRGDISDDESNFSGYHVQIKEEPSDNIVVDAEGNSNGITILGMKMDKSYSCRVQAKTDTYRYTAWSEWSESKIVNPIFTNIKIYPNPFKRNRDLKITFCNLGNDFMTIKIYNISGELVYEGNKGIDKDNFEWTVTNNYGIKVSSGIYIYQIDAGSYSKTSGKIAVLN